MQSPATGRHRTHPTGKCGAPRSKGRRLRPCLETVLRRVRSVAPVREHNRLLPVGSSSVPDEPRRRSGRIDRAAGRGNLGGGVVGRSTPRSDDCSSLVRRGGGQRLRRRAAGVPLTLPGHAGVLLESAAADGAVPRRPRPAQRRSRWRRNWSRRPRAWTSTTWKAGSETTRKTGVCRLTRNRCRNPRPAAPDGPKGKATAASVAGRCRPRRTTFRRAVQEAVVAPAALSIPQPGPDLVLVYLWLLWPRGAVGKSLLGDPAATTGDAPLTFSSYCVIFPTQGTISEKVAASLGDLFPGKMLEIKRATRTSIAAS